MYAYIISALDVNPRLNHTPQTDGGARRHGERRHFQQDRGRARFARGRSDKGLRAGRGGREGGGASGGTGAGARESTAPKSVNLIFQLVTVNDKLTILWESCLFKTD